ncbi:MAG: GGDEF domain-containing protein [Acidobacteria bacterium]|nr:GGDEF domain-containing protein [Acidobacteriota bacterium]
MPPPDLASRLRASQSRLRRTLGRPAVLSAMVRDANATLDPERVADVILARAAEWLQATAWFVLASEGVGEARVLSTRGGWRGADLAARVAAAWVIRNGAMLASGNIGADRRLVTAGSRRRPVSSRGALIAIPLVSRGRVFGAAVGLDRHPADKEPGLSRPVLRMVEGVLDPAMVALDNALRMARAEALSVTDDLTSLYNSRYLWQALRRETKRASRSGRPLSLLFIDLDGFKEINDHHGHLCGSKALVEAAEVIRASARETDMIARYGGDEFALLLPDTGSEGAIAVGERIRERVAAHTFLESDGLSIRLTASVGVATLPDVATSVEGLIRAADMAMYRVKGSGKNGIDAAT